MAAVNLNSLSANQLRNLFDSVDHILSDNDGVLSVFGALLPGVAECVNKLRASGKSFKVVTNNSAFGRRRLAATFQKQCLQFESDDFITPTCAITNYLKHVQFSGKIWLMGFEPMMAELKEKGFTLAESEYPRTIPVTEAQKYILSTDPEIKAIVVDICLNTTAGCITKAIDYLNTDPDILLLFGSTDALLPIGHEKYVLGPKAFQNILVEETGRVPLVFGKPSKNFGKYLIETLKCDPSRTLFIGDSLEQDIGFAKQLGFKQLLVLSGITKIEDLENCNDDFKPDYYISNLEKLNSLLTL